jgi:hypothetical protein
MAKRPTEKLEPESSSGVRSTGIVGVATLVLGVVGACGTTTTSSTTPAASATAAASSSPTASAMVWPTSDPTAGWVSYHSTVNHLAFRHPPSWQPVECNGVTAVDNTSATCTPGEGPAANLTIFTDQGQRNYTGAWAATPVSVNGVVGRCFTDTPPTQTPASDNGPVLAYTSYTVCDVEAGSTAYHFTFYMPPSRPNPSNNVTQSQFELFLQTVTFDS